MYLSANRVTDLVPTKATFQLFRLQVLLLLCRLVVTYSSEERLVALGFAVCTSYSM